MCGLATGQHHAKAGDHLARTRTFVDDVLQAIGRFGDPRGTAASQRTQAWAFVTTAVSG
jgi:hypothetical protein